MFYVCSLGPEGKSLLKSVERGDRDGAIALRVGMGYLREKDYGNAKGYLTAAVGGDPKNPLAWYMLGKCCEGLFAYARTIRCYEQAHKLRPEFNDQVARDLGRIRQRGLLNRLSARVRMAWGG